MSLLQKQQVNQGGQQILSQIHSHNSQIPQNSVESFERLSFAIINREKPTLLRINADNQSKKFIIISLLVLFLFLLIVIIIAKTLPSSIVPITNKMQLQSTYLSSCINPNTISSSNILKCGQFSPSTPSVGLMINRLKPTNQFMILYLVITPKVSTQKIIINDPISFTIYDVNVKNSQYEVKMYTNQTLNIVFDMQKPTEFEDRNGIKIMGYNLYMGFFQDLSHPNIYINAKFSDKFIQLVNINTIQLQVPDKFINTLFLQAFKISQQFTIFSILVRQIFFILSVIALILYTRVYIKIPISQRSVQQKLIWILSILLLFFNDPLYPITILKENMFRQFIYLFYQYNICSSFLSIIFVVTFLVFLMFTWIIFLSRILYEQGQKQTKLIKKWKIIYFIILQILFIVLYMLLSSFRLNNHPLIGEQDLSTKKFFALQIIIFVMFCIVFVYIIGLYVRNLIKLQQLQWRSTLYMIYSCVFVFSFFTFFQTDRSFGPYYYNGSTIMVLYGFLNFYVWYLQYMYTVTKQGNQGINQIKINQNDQIATIEFNDISINLDQNNILERKKQYLSKQKQEKKQDQYYQNINNNNNNYNKSNNNNIYGFPSNSQLQLQQNIKAYNNNNNNKQKQIDFFNQDNNNNNNNNNNNHTNNNNHNNHNNNNNIHHYDQHNDSLFDDDNNDNKHKKSDDFGSFQML